MGEARVDALTLVTAPASLPITVEEAKGQMRVEHADDDAVIGRLINAAVAFVDAGGVLGRAMITQTWAQTVDRFYRPLSRSRVWSNDRVAVTMSPVQALTAVKYYDTDNALQTATLSDFRLIGGANDSYVEPVGSWPNTFDRPDALQIEVRVGYGDAASDVPDTVRHALLMLVAHWYENREEYSETGLKRTPMGFDALIGVERASWYG